jgi:hypothetical protein
MIFALPQAWHEEEEQNGPCVPAYAPVTLAHWLLLPQLQLA